MQECFQEWDSNDYVKWFCCKTCKLLDIIIHLIIRAFDFFFFFIRIFRLRNFFWPSQSAYTDDIIDSRPFRSRNTSDALAHVSIISTTWPVHTVSTAFQISIVPSASIFLLFFYYHYPSLLILSVANKNLLISYLRPITGQFAINRNNYFSSFHAMGGEGGGVGKEKVRCETTNSLQFQSL